jgi:hypothetical protein
MAAREADQVLNLLSISSTVANYCIGKTPAAHQKSVFHTNRAVTPQPGRQTTRIVVPRVPIRRVGGS